MMASTSGRVDVERLERRIRRPVAADGVAAHEVLDAVDAHVDRIARIDRVPKPESRWPVTVRPYRCA